LTAAAVAAEATGSITYVTDKPACGVVRTTGADLLVRLVSGPGYVEQEDDLTVLKNGGATLRVSAFGSTRSTARFALSGRDLATLRAGIAAARLSTLKASYGSVPPLPATRYVISTSRCSIGVIHAVSAPSRLAHLLRLLESIAATHGG
jgi:hypothetical protein